MSYNNCFQYLYSTSVPHEGCIHFNPLKHWKVKKLAKRAPKVHLHCTSSVTKPKRKCMYKATSMWNDSANLHKSVQKWIQNKTKMKLKKRSNSALLRQRMQKTLVFHPLYCSHRDGTSYWMCHASFNSKLILLMLQMVNLIYIFFIKSI